MTTRDLTSPSISVAWGGNLADECDPDFSFPAEEVRYRVPLWIVGAVAVACVSLLFSRPA